MNEFRLILAPIRGLTQEQWRRAYVKNFAGLDGAVDQFINSVIHKRGRAGNETGDENLKDIAGEGEGPSYSKLIYRLDPAKDAMITVPQILSNSADDFVPLANALYAKGYTEVNWNLGCPHPLVTSKKKGSALLPYPHLIEKFLESALPRLTGRLSIKLRLGYEHSDEILDLLPVFERFELASLTVHARTGRQMYEGNCDLDAFEKCLARTRHRLVYNGDIKTKEDFDILAARFPAIKDYMIGRGVLSDPFLPARIRGDWNQDSDAELVRLRSFHDDIYSEYSCTLSSPAHLLDKMKGVWEWLSQSFDQSHKTFKRIRKATSLAHYSDEVGRIFG